MAGQIPTRAAALKHVATVLIGAIQAGDIIETGGLDETTLTKAEMGRLEWAMGDVAGRLAKLGGTGKPEE